MVSIYYCKAPYPFLHSQVGSQNLLPLMGPKVRDEQVEIYYDLDCKYPSHQSSISENKNSLALLEIQFSPFCLTLAPFRLSSASRFKQEASSL